MAAAESSQYNLFLQGKALEQQFAQTVDSAVNFGVYIQSTLDEIKSNTRTLFWWTSIAVLIVLGLFIVGQLARLRRELITLNTYQNTFKGMWDEDRRFEMEQLDEQRRYREGKEIERRNREAREFQRQRERSGRGGAGNSFRGRGGIGGLTTPHEGRRPMSFGAGTGVDGLLGSLPPRGSQELQDLLASVARETQRQRQRQQQRQHQQQQEYEEEEEDEDEEEEEEESYDY
ncbi:hypothetical protein F4779DRAFT_562160 [Xylariaceae sp. FL0662B]|nr:hypothetical protein F4779DRAFT_562160 [Xylariaceae sp. FL0662B]